MYIGVGTLTGMNWIIWSNPMRIKPTTLVNVREFYKRLGAQLCIVGCGGVTTGRDVYEHILCGASAVQIGTQLMKETPKVFDRIQLELKEIMLTRGLTNLAAFRGKLECI